MGPLTGQQLPISRIRVKKYAANTRFAADLAWRRKIGFWLAGWINNGPPQHADDIRLLLLPSPGP